MSKQSDLVSVSQGASGDPLFIDTVNDRVGVGTSSPSFKLSVKQSAQTFNGGIALERSDNTNRFNIAIDSNTTLNIGYNDSTKAVITSAGNVGIGTSSPAAKLHVAGGTGSTIRNTASAGSSWFVGSNVDAYILHNESNTPMVLTTNGTERMRIDSAGRVTMPYQPAFTAYSSISTLHTTVGAFPLQNTVINVGNHYNTSTYNFTAPIAGTYKFTISALVASGGHLTLLRNGSYVAGGSGGASGIHQVGASYTQVCKEFILTLAASDNIALYQENTNAVYRDWVVMTGYLLG